MLGIVRLLKGTRLLIACIAAIAVPATNAMCAGTAWQTNGVPVCTVANSQESPYCAGVGSGQSVIVWADTRGIDYDIYAQKLDADGRALWTDSGVKVCGADYDQQFPAVVDDGAGGAIVVWQDGRLGDDGLDIYAQRVLSNGTLAWQIDGVPVCSHISGLTDPPMAFSQVVTGDGSGGVIVAWRDTRNDPVNGNTEIYAQKMDVNGAAKWTTNGVKILGFGTQKWATRNPVITPDGAGGAVVAWQDARTSTATGNDLYIQRVNSAGTALWTSNGIVVCNAIGDQGYPDIASLSGGTAAITWEDKRSGNYDIYVQQFSASGSPAWTANGRLICGSANDQRTPRICADGSGGVVIAWTDKRDSTLYTDIYAQRLDAAGNGLWGSQGTAVCTASGSQTRVRISPSLSSSTILTWMDTRDETLSAVYDIYGQMISSSATPMWNAGGIAVGAITGSNQRMHQGANDDTGSMCVVWEDDRDAGDWNIFAQKLSPWTTVSGIPAAKSVSAGVPISLPPCVVSGSFSGFFYMQDASRSTGIRVEYPQTFAPGAEVSVSGTLQAGLEPIIKASVVTPAGSGDAPTPLGITASRLGSALIGKLEGLSNTGLLVRTWGRVVSKQTATEPYMVINDGARDIRVYSGMVVEVGDTVTITGVCSGESTPSGETIAAILTRDSNDARNLSR